MILSNFSVEFCTSHPYCKLENNLSIFSQSDKKKISWRVFPSKSQTFHLNCRNTLSIRVPLFALPIAGPCPAPFISVAGGCYQFLDSMSVTWDVGRITCQDSGGRLAVIDDCSVMADIIRFIEGAGQPNLKKRELMLKWKKNHTYNLKNH